MDPQLSYPGRGREHKTAEERYKRMGNKNTSSTKQKSPAKTRPSNNSKQTAPSSRDSLKKVNQGRESPLKRQTPSASPNSRPSNPAANTLPIPDSFQPQTNQLSSQPTASPQRRGSANRLSEVEIQQRMEATNENKTVTHAGITIQYAWVSQRGFYPDGTKV